MTDMSTAKSGQVLVRTLKDGTSSIMSSSMPPQEWLKPKPAQAGDCIKIDSFQKKRTGFGPHSCDDPVHDYLATDHPPVMQDPSPAFIRLLLQAGNCVA